MFHMPLELGSYNHGNIGTQEHLMIFYGNKNRDMVNHQQSWAMETLGYNGDIWTNKGAFLVSKWDK